MEISHYLNYWLWKMVKQIWLRGILVDIEDKGIIFYTLIEWQSYLDQVPPGISVNNCLNVFVFDRAYLTRPIQNWLILILKQSHQNLTRMHSSGNR